MKNIPPGEYLWAVAIADRKRNNLPVCNWSEGQSSKKLMDADW